MTKLNNKNQTPQNTENHSCPNCWGKTEYDGKLCVQNMVNDDQKGWIQKYTEKKLF